MVVDAGWITKDELCAGVPAGSRRRLQLNLGSSGAAPVRAAPHRVQGDRDAAHVAQTARARSRSTCACSACSGALVVIWLVFHAVTGGLFLTPRNLFNLSVQTASVAVMATGMVFVIVTRNIDLSVGSLLGLLGMIMAVTQVRDPAGDRRPRALEHLDRRDRRRPRRRRADRRASRAG